MVTLKKIIPKNLLNRWTSGAYFVHFQYFQGQILVKIKNIENDIILLYITTTKLYLFKADFFLSAFDLVSEDYVQFSFCQENIVSA